MNRRGIVSAVLVVLLVGGIVGLLRTWRPLAGDCTADGLEIEAPEGWDFVRDRENMCEWTLLNPQGDRAPRVLYEGLSIDPPPSPVMNLVRLVPIVMILGSVAGLVVVSQQRERQVRSPS